MKDGGEYFTVYSQDDNNNYYILRNMVVGSYHHVYGHFATSTFIYKNRPKMHLRVYAEELKPVQISNCIIITNAEKSVKGFNIKKEYLLRLKITENLKSSWVRFSEEEQTIPFIKNLYLFKESMVQSKLFLEHQLPVQVKTTKIKVIRENKDNYYDEETIEYKEGIPMGDLSKFK